MVEPQRNSICSVLLEQLEEEEKKMNPLSAHFNKINRLNRGICSLSDLQPGVAYEVLEFQRIHTKYGTTLVATLKIVGYTGEDPPIRVFLPNRLNKALSDDDISSYNDNPNKPVCMIYRGLVKRRHEIEFL